MKSLYSLEISSAHDQDFLWHWAICMSCTRDAALLWKQDVVHICMRHESFGYLRVMDQSYRTPERRVGVKYAYDLTNT